jgi:hypothetical protein
MQYTKREKIARGEAWCVNPQGGAASAPGCLLMVQSSRNKSGLGFVESSGDGNGEQVVYGSERVKSPAGPPRVNGSRAPRTCIFAGNQRGRSCIVIQQ